MTPRNALKLLLVNVVLLAGLLSLAELSLHSLRRASEWIPDVMLKTARRLYWNERNLIQFSRDCARYDERLFYTLRPGECTFDGPEFSNVYRVNRMGLRDDEESIEAPEVVVIGDSHAMGWGVDQSDTFAQVIESRTGVRVLNAGISSYGTAREIASLERLDTSRLKLLIVQYCENDLWENLSYREAGNLLEISSRDKYAESIQSRGEVRYRFGQDLARVIGWQLDELTGRGRAAAAGRDAHREAATLFLTVLENAGVSLESVEVVTFEISNYGEVSPFVASMQSALDSGSTPETVPGIQVIDAAALLEPSNYYRLDGHLNASGHHVVADAIVQKSDWLQKRIAARASSG